MSGTNKISLDRLREFAQIAKHGSFRAAALSLGMPLASLSRHIRDLELELGERLLDRTKRKVQLTASGARLLALIEDPISQIDSAYLEFGNDLTPTKGPVHIATSSVLAQMLILPIFPKLRSLYPGIILDLILDADIVNMRDNSVDFALRAGNVEGEPQIRKKIARHHFVHYAASHVDKPEQLPVVAYDKEQPDAEVAVMFAKDGLLLKEMVLNGLVTGWGPDALMLPYEKQGKLVRLHNCRDFGFDVFLCYPERGQLGSRARLIVEEISKFAKTTQLELERALPELSQQ